jgi:uncharacterized protein
MTLLKELWFFGDGMSELFYVYALKDPRRSPAQPFYIGKGIGTRAWDHALNVDETAKGRRIREISASGSEVLVSVLSDGLSEMQALKLESELIAAFGTEATGGLLTNSVLPSGSVHRTRRGLVVPSGVREKSQIGLALLKEAVLELAKANRDGITNADAANALGLKSDYGGGSKDYLSFSLIGMLLREGRLRRDEEIGRGRHVATVR